MPSTIFCIKNGPMCSVLLHSRNKLRVATATDVAAATNIAAATDVATATNIAAATDVSAARKCASDTLKCRGRPPVQ